VAVDILRKALPGSRQAALFTSKGRDPQPKDIADLDVVGWKMVQDFTQKFGALPLPEREREAKAAKLIAVTVVEKAPRYVIRTKVVGLLADIVEHVIAHLVGIPELVVPLAGICHRDFHSIEKEELRSGRERRWLGFIHER
jgi:hypothetical protein